MSIFIYIWSFIRNRIWLNRSEKDSSPESLIKERATEYLILHQVKTNGHDLRPTGSIPSLLQAGKSGCLLLTKIQIPHTVTSVDLGKTDKLVWRERWWYWPCACMTNSLRQERHTRVLACVCHHYQCLLSRLTESTIGCVKKNKHNPCKTCVEHLIMHKFHVTGIVLNTSVSKLVVSIVNEFQLQKRKKKQYEFLITK